MIASSGYPAIVEPSVLVYDADCGFCRWAISKILFWDRHRRLRPVALQDDEAASLLPGMDETERMASWHLVAPDGSIHSAGRAVAPLLRQLPWGYGPARIADAFPGAMEWLYRWGAGHREWLGRLVGARACSVDPQATHPRRRRPV